MGGRKGEKEKNNGREERGEGKNNGREERGEGDE